MRFIFFTILFSFSCFASDFLEVAGKRYELHLQEILCVNGASDLFNPASRITYNEMTRAGCNIESRLGKPVDCSKIDDKFLIRNFIVSHLREKNYCNCRQGPSECVSFCSKFLLLEECAGICTGNCGAQYPRK